MVVVPAPQVFRARLCATRGQSKNATRGQHSRALEEVISVAMALAMQLNVLVLGLVEARHARWHSEHAPVPGAARTSATRARTMVAEREGRQTPR